MNKIKVFFTLLIVVFLMACQEEQQIGSSENQNQSSGTLGVNFFTNVKYAKGFHVVNCDNYKEVYVFHPLNDDTLACYITTASVSALSDSVKAKGHVVEVPIKDLVCLSTTHISSLSILNLRDKLVGCLSPEYIYDKQLRERLKNGSLKQVGKGMSVNSEQVVSLSPSAIMQSFMDKTDVDGKLSSAGITVLYNNEWKEECLLGRTEWIKFVALFLGREFQADSIFNAIETNYLEIKNKALVAEYKPTVMYGNGFRGTWYIPQSNTYAAQIFRDANADFYDAGKGNASIPKNFEEVYHLYNDAEYWFCTLSKINTMEGFLSSNQRYIDFRAAKEGNVFSNNKRENSNGGNDYWESAVNRPDLLLKDVVKILHPELYPDYKTTYWQHLK